MMNAAGTEILREATRRGTEVIRQQNPWRRQYYVARYKGRAWRKGLGWDHSRSGMATQLCGPISHGGWRISMVCV